MKISTITLMTLFLCGTLFAQSPAGFNYQAVAKDNGTLIVGSVGLQLSILQESTSGTAVYVERHFPTTNSYGILNVEVGSGTVVSGVFADIDWGEGSYFLKTELDPLGGANYVDLGTSQLLSVPYALYATKAAEVETETQMLVLEEDQLSISQGNTVSLSELGSVWEETVDGLCLVEENISLGLENCDALAKLHVTDDQTSASTYGVIRAEYTGTDFNDGVAVWGRSMPVDNYGIGGLFEGGYRGVVGNVQAEGTGIFTGVYGLANGGDGTNYAIYGTASGGNTNYAGYFVGDVRVSNNLDVDNIDAFNDVTTFNLYAESSSFFGGTTGARAVIQSDGIFRSYGSSSENAYAGNPVIDGTSYSNNGFVAVSDASGAIQAGIYVDESGNGIVFGDTKNFRMEHPSDDNKEIWYASLEGPEAAAYERGTGILQQGGANILFSEHFAEVANPTTMTVIVTPLSAESKGLAVIEKTPTGFVVKELHGSSGNYAFDWEVKCVRKGFEDYQAVRDKSSSPQAVAKETLTENPATPVEIVRPRLKRVKE